MAPLAIPPSPDGELPSRGRSLSRRNRGRRAFVTAKSNKKDEIKRSNTEGDLNTAPVHTQNRASESPRRWSLLGRRGRSSVERSTDRRSSLSPHSLRRIFGGRRQSVSPNGRGNPQVTKSASPSRQRGGRRQSTGDIEGNASLSPGRLLRGGGVLKSLRNILSSPSPGAFRSKVSVVPNNDGYGEESPDPSDPSDQLGELPFINPLDEESVEKDGKIPKQSQSTFPTAEITVVNLDEWDTDDEDVSTTETDTDYFSSDRPSPELRSKKGLSKKKSKPKKKKKKKDPDATPVHKNKKRWEEKKEEIKGPLSDIGSGPAHLEDSYNNSSTTSSSYRVSVSKPGEHHVPLPSSLNRYEASPATTIKKLMVTPKEFESPSITKKKKVEFERPSSAPPTPGERKKALMNAKIQKAKTKATTGKASTSDDEPNLSQWKTPFRYSEAPPPMTDSTSDSKSQDQSSGKAAISKKTKKERSRAPPVSKSGAWNRPLNDDSSSSSSTTPSEEGVVRTVKSRSLRPGGSAPSQQRSDRRKEGDSNAMFDDAKSHLDQLPVDQKSFTESDPLAWTTFGERTEQAEADYYGSWRNPLSTKRVSLKPAQDEPAFQNRSIGSFIGSTGASMKRPSASSFDPFPDPPSGWIDEDRASKEEGETVETLTKEIDNLMDETVELRQQLTDAWEKIADLTKQESGSRRIQSDLQDSGGLADDERESADNSSSTDPFDDEQETALFSTGSMTEAADLENTDGREDDPLMFETDEVEPEVRSLLSESKHLREQLAATAAKFERPQLQRSCSAGAIESDGDKRTGLKRSNSDKSPMSMVIDTSRPRRIMEISTRNLKASVHSISKSSGTKPSGSLHQIDTSMSSRDQDDTINDTLGQSYNTFYGSFALQDDDEGPNPIVHNEPNPSGASSMDSAKNLVPMSKSNEFRVAHGSGEGPKGPTTLDILGSSGALDSSSATMLARGVQGDSHHDGLAKQQQELARQLEEWRVELEQKEDRLSDEMRDMKSKNKDLEKRKREMEDRFKEWKEQLQKQEEQLKESELKSKQEKEEYNRMQQELKQSLEERSLEQSDARRQISRVTRLHMELNVSLKKKMAKIAILVRDLSKLAVKLEEKATVGEGISPLLRAELRVIQNRIRKQLFEMEKDDLQLDFEISDLSSLHGGKAIDSSSIVLQTEGLKKETDRVLDRLKQKQIAKADEGGPEKDSNLDSSHERDQKLLTTPPGSVSTKRSGPNSEEYDSLLKEVKALREENKTLRSSGNIFTDVGRVKKKDAFVADMQGEVESLLKDLAEKSMTESPSTAFKREKLVLKALNRALVVKLAMEPSDESEDTRKKSAAIRSMKRELEKLRRDLLDPDTPSQGPGSALDVASVE